MRRIPQTPVPPNNQSFPVSPPQYVDRVARGRLVVTRDKLQQADALKQANELANGGTLESLKEAVEILSEVLWEVVYDFGKRPKS